MLDAAAFVRETEQAVYEVMLLHDAATLGAAEAVVERLRVLRASVDGAYAPAAAAHAEAMLAADGPALDDVSRDFEAMGMNLVAAEAAFQAVQAYRANGLIARASSSTSRGERLAGLCEGARTPALMSAAQPLSLTSREREIATLAAALSNKEIADRLVLSVRTVEWHLQRAYAKLGIESRDELAATLGLR